MDSISLLSAVVHGDTVNLSIKVIMNPNELLPLNTANGKKKPVMNHTVLSADG